MLVIHFGINSEIKFYALIDQTDWLIEYTFQLTIILTKSLFLLFDVVVIDF